MAKNDKSNAEELRFNYLGFDYEPGKVKEFWSSDEEKQRYLKKIRDQGGKIHSMERDFSVVNASLLNKADRIIISVASVFLVLSLFLPYYSFQAFDKHISGSALGFLFNLGYISNITAWSGPMMGLMLALAIMLIIVSPLVGVLNLIALNSGQTNPNYFAKVKSNSKLNIYALLLYILFFLLFITSQTNPFGSLGIEAVGDSLNIGSLIAMAGFGFWINIGAHILGMLPATEL